MSENLDRETEALIEQYLLFLRGRGPEPSLPAERREEILALLELVGALAEREPPLPDLQHDPVAVRLGLVAGPSPDGGASHEGDGDTTVPASPLALALHELDHHFGGYVEVELSTSWDVEHAAPSFVRVATCTSLGETVAVFIAPVVDWETEPEGVATIFRRHPEVTAVALAAEDAQRAVVLTAADANRALDPVRGWLDPGSPSSPEPVVIALGRHFERVLPRWDRISRLDERLEVADAPGVVADVTTREVAHALGAKPRLEYKKSALRSLAALEPHAIAAVVVDVQSEHLPDNQLLARLAAVAEAAAS